MVTGKEQRTVNSNIKYCEEAMFTRFGIPPHLERARKTVGKLCSLALLFFPLIACGSKSNDPKPVVIKQMWYTPAWSPDGAQIAAIVERVDDSGEVHAFIAVLDAETGEVIRESAVNPPIPFWFDWTYDSRWVLFSSSPGIFKISADLDSVVQLTSGEAHGWPSYSKARDLVFFAINNGANGGLFSVTLDGDSLRRWSTDETIVGGVCTFPDDSDSLIGYDTSTLPFQLVIFAPDEIGNSIRLGKEFLQQIPARVSGDHRRVAYIDWSGTSTSLSLHIIERATGAVSAVAIDVGEDMDFSPDGTKLLYPVVKHDVGLWILDFQSGRKIRLTGGSTN